MKNIYRMVCFISLAATFSYADITAIGDLTATATNASQRAYSTSDYIAIAFHTGAAPSDGGWTNFSFTVQTHDGSWPVSGVIELWRASSSGEPGWKDATYTLPGTQPAGGLVTVTNATSHKLLENEDYSLVIHATSGSALVEMTDDLTTLDPNPASGWTLGNSRWDSLDSGSNWSEGSTTSRMKVSINVDAIPEPAVLGLMVLMGGGFVVTNRILRT